jgi:N-acetyltransferase 10
VTDYCDFFPISQEDMREKMEVMLDPDKLQQFAIAGTEAEFDEALAGGKLPQSGLLSVKSSGAKKADRKEKAKGGKAGKEKRKTDTSKRPASKKARKQT